MTINQSLHNDYKICPQCGQSLPLAYFVAYYQGKENRPIMVSICASCRQQNLEEDTRQGHKANLDLDTQDLWLRARNKEAIRQEQINQHELVYAQQEQAEHEHKHQDDLTEKKKKQHFYAQDDDWHTISKQLDHDVDEARASRNSELDDTHQHRYAHAINIHYDNYFALHYEDFNVSFTDRLMNLMAHRGVNLELIDPHIFNRVMYENPQFIHLHQFINTTPGIERNTAYLSTRARHLNPTAYNQSSYTPRSQYTIEPNNTVSQADYSQHKYNPSLTQSNHASSNKTHQNSYSAGLFAKSPAFNGYQAENKRSASASYANNSLFKQNNELPQNNEEDSELTSFIKKTWGKK